MTTTSEWCEENQIHICTEPPNSSGFLQALDQYNKKWHETYKRAVKQYRADMNDDDVTVNMSVFLMLLGKYYFTWASALEREASFRRVGLCSVLRPDLVNRTRFHDRFDNIVHVLEEQAVMHAHDASQVDSPTPQKQKLEAVDESPDGVPAGAGGGGYS